jgi:hypothetical protein
MMLRGLLALLLLLLPVAALSDPIPVRSGEHDSFTRLTIALPQRLPWRVTRRDRIADLVLDGPTLAFDTATVFNRISGQRLSGITPSETGLRLDLGCDCDVAGFWHGDSLLVVDIRDAVAETAFRPNSASVSYDPYTSGPSAAAALTIRKMGLDSLQGNAETLDAPQATAAPPLAETRHALLSQLSRAASQGLVKQRKIGGIDLDKEAHSLSEIPASPNMNLRAETSMDREVVKLIEENLPDLPHQDCISDDTLNIREWADDRPIWLQIGPLRGRLTTEADKIDPNAALDLARVYIHHAFGAEAIAVLDTSQAASPDAAILRDLATILEFDSILIPNHLANQIGCPGAAGLWSVLARSTLPLDTPIDRNSILLAFSSMPYHLRLYLGPGLAQRFSDAADHDTAKQILTMIERGPLPAPPPVRLARAELDMATGLDASAQEILTEVAESNSHPSAEALIRIVELHIANDQLLSFDTAQLVAAYATENRTGPLADDLAWAQVAALSAARAFHEAFELLETVEDRLPPERPAIRSILARHLAEHADEMVFLRHSLGGDLGPPSSLSAASANAVADRLLALGFPEPARGLVAATVADAGAERDRQLLRARAALALGRPRQAEVDLLDLTDKDANSLRAQARSMIGEHDAAHEYYTSSGQETEALNEAWMAENWMDLKRSDDAGLSELASLLTAEGAALDPAMTEGVLARNRALLETSDRMRKTIAAILEARQPPALMEN